jgi:predicted CXXCH cytochrome family protein
VAERVARALVLAAGLGLASAGAGRAAEPVNTCIDCHAAIGDPRITPPAQKIKDDVHLARGFACQSCHGGDPTVGDPDGSDGSMSKRKGFVGKPPRQAIPALCGRCHSDAEFMKRYNPSMRVDQVQEYYTSVHGKRLRAGDPKAATCISCHSVHNIRAIKDQQAWTYPVQVAETCARCHADPEYMAGRKLATDQFARYRRSVHFELLTKQGDLSAPTCNSCHGNHGAAPPGLASVEFVCGQCHAVFAEQFDRSPHKAAFERMGAAPCTTCHGNHEVERTSDAMLGLGGQAVCIGCHDAASAGGRKAEEMRAVIDGLRQAVAEAEALLRRAEQAGMEVSLPLFDLKGGTEALIKARAAVHTFTLAAVKQEADAGLAIAAAARQKGERALADLQFRRKGLAASLVIIGLVLAGLVLKIREVERRSRP